MAGELVPSTRREVEVGPQDARKTTIEVNMLVLISLRKTTACSKKVVEQHDLCHQDTNHSSVHMDKGLEYHRLRTSASTPALVPLLIVLSAARPVPAHAYLLATPNIAVSLTIAKERQNIASMRLSV